MPPSLTDWISAGSNVVVALAAAAAAWQGIKGLSNWRHETIGRRRLELAEESLTTFYEIEDAIRAIRSPFSYSSESADRARSENEDDREKRVRDTGYIPIKRLQDHSELISKFFAQNYRVRATFGRQFDEPYDRVKQCLQRIRVSAQMLMMTDPYESPDPKLRREWEGDIWEGAAPGENSIETRVRQAVGLAESLFEAQR